MRRLTDPLSILATPLLLVAGVLAAQPAEPPSAPVSGDGYLGVTIRNLNPDLRRHFGAPSKEGVLIASVVPESPAAAAGLAVGDVLTSVDRRSVGSSTDLRRTLRDRAGERAELEVYRDGERLRLEATLGLRETVARGPWAVQGPGSAEEWDDWSEEWGERFGERWGRWGAEMGESLGERGAALGEIGAELGALGGELGAELGSLGAEIGLEVAGALAGMDWDEMGEAVDDSLDALEAMDWERLAEEIERALEESAAELERGLSELDAALQESHRHPR